MQAEVADTAQASQDAAAAVLRHIAASPGAGGPGGGGRSRQALARRARVSAAAAQAPHAPWRAYPAGDGHALPREVEGHLRSALNAAAERAAATEAHVMLAAADVDRALAQRGAAGSAEAVECAAALTRLLNVAHDVTDRPSEASIKQLV